MSHEIEAKYRVETFDAVGHAIAAAGGTFLGRVVQTDRFFDHPDHSLRDSDQGLRLRQFELLEQADGQPVDLRPLLTYKGPRSNTDTAKRRREVQTHLDCPAVITEVLAVCGVTAKLVLQKRRASYRVADVLVELDELPRIGRFVEIEADSDRQVTDWADRLGLGDQPITESYFALLAERFADVRNGDCVKIVFDEGT
jgi:predicted adenylyl cyclase CyaB